MAEMENVPKGQPKNPAYKAELKAASVPQGQDAALIEAGVTTAARNRGLLWKGPQMQGDPKLSIDGLAVINAAKRDPLAYMMGKQTEQHLKSGTATLSEVTACEHNTSCTAGMVVAISPPFVERMTDGQVLLGAGAAKNNSTTQNKRPVTTKPPRLGP